MYLPMPIAPRNPAPQRPASPRGAIPGLPPQAADRARLALAQRPISSMKKGGKVKKTGTYKLHAGEMVMPMRGMKDVESHSYDFRKPQGAKKK